jgi:hypothetical protein
LIYRALLFGPDEKTADLRRSQVAEKQPYEKPTIVGSRLCWLLHPSIESQGVFWLILIKYKSDDQGSAAADSLSDDTTFG